MGASRFFFVLLRHAPSQAGDRKPAFASSLPRRRRAARHSTATPRRGSRGACRPPWSMGVRKGEPTSPSGRSRRRNAGRGPGRESPGRGLQGGATAPLLDGSRESRSLPVSRCNGDHVASAGTGSMPVSASGRLNNPLARRSSRSGRALGIPWGVRGGWEIPPQGVARYYRAHLVRFEWRRPAILYYGERTLNCGEHYRAAIEQSRNVHYSAQFHSAIILHCTRKFSTTGY